MTFPTIQVICNIAQEVNARTGNGAGQISPERGNQIYERLPNSLKEEIAFWGSADPTTQKMIRSHLLLNT